MDNPILRMLVEKVGNLFSVCIEGERMEGDHTVDLATHCLYFIIVCAPFLPVYHEIKLNPVAVYVTVVVHDHRFGTSRFMMVKSINILIGSSIVTFISFDFLSADASIG